MNLGGYQIVDCSNISMSNRADRAVLYRKLVDALKYNKPILISNLEGSTFFSNVKAFENVDKYDDGVLISGAVFTMWKLDITTFYFALVGIDENGALIEQTLTNAIEF